MTLAAQNVTNFVNGQSITNGTLFSSVPSAGEEAQQIFG